CLQAGKRPGETADRIRDYGIAECAVALCVLVGVYQHFADLRPKTVEHMGDHRLAVEFYEPLVDPAHAPPLPARQHDAGDGAHGSAGHGNQGTCSSKNAWPCGARSTGSSNAARATCVSPGHLSDSKKSLVPQMPQNDRLVFVDDSYRTRSSAPSTIVT